MKNSKLFTLSLVFIGLFCIGISTAKGLTATVEYPLNGINDYTGEMPIIMRYNISDISELSMIKIFNTNHFQTMVGYGTREKEFNNGKEVIVGNDNYLFELDYQYWNQPIELADTRAGVFHYVQPTDGTLNLVSAFIYKSTIGSITLYCTIYNTTGIQITSPVPQTYYDSGSEYIQFSFVDQNLYLYAGETYYFVFWTNQYYGDETNFAYMYGDSHPYWRNCNRSAQIDTVYGETWGERGLENITMNNEKIKRINYTWNVMPMGYYNYNVILPSSGSMIFYYEEIMFLEFYKISPETSLVYSFRAYPYTTYIQCSDTKEKIDSNTTTFQVGINTTQTKCNPDDYFLSGVLTFDTNQLYFLILLSLWLLFLFQYIERRKTPVAGILCLTQFGFMFPLTLVMAGISYYNSLIFGWIIVFMFPIISLYILIDYLIYSK